MQPKLIYLASPYSHPEAHIEELRFNQITRLAAKYTVEFGHAFICPITQSYQLVQHSDGALKGSFDKWREIDLRFIQACDEVWVVKMLGWDKSIGVQEEIKFALANSKPVIFKEAE